MVKQYKQLTSGLVIPEWVPDRWGRRHIQTDKNFRFTPGGGCDGAGCGCSSEPPPNCGCGADEGDTPLQVQVTITDSMGPGNCASCDSFNGTWILDWEENPTTYDGCYYHKSLETPICGCYSMGFLFAPVGTSYSDGSVCMFVLWLDDPPQSTRQLSYWGTVCDSFACKDLDHTANKCGSGNYWCKWDMTSTPPSPMVVSYKAL